MDNNLSITIDVKKVSEILKEKTHSGVPRLDRIKENNPELFEKLGAPDKVTEKLSEDLIDWSNELNVTISSDIENAKIELNVYIKLIELLTTSIDDVEATAVLLKNFTYKGICAVMSRISVNSKIISRINNLKFLCMQYTRKNLSAQTKKYYYEMILGEVFYQKSYLIIFNKNIEDFRDSNFPLGMLLYDIPGGDDNSIDFIKKSGN